MPNNPFFNFLQSIIRFFQSGFLWLISLMTPFYRMSPLPDSVDFLILCLVVVGIIFLVFQASPWEKK